MLDQNAWGLIPFAIIPVAALIAVIASIVGHIKRKGMGK